jgi:hypothetical protein
VRAHELGIVGAGRHEYRIDSRTDARFEVRERVTYKHDILASLESRREYAERPLEYPRIRLVRFTTIRGLHQRKVFLELVIRERPGQLIAMAGGEHCE